MTKKKRPPKTMKEKAFVKEYVSNGGNATRAAIKVYDCKNYDVANAMGAQVMNRIDMRSSFVKAGLDPDVIAQNTTRIALTAKKIHGTGDDFIEIDDNPTQLNAMRFAAELMDIMPKPEQNAFFNVFTNLRESGTQYNLTD